MSLSNTAVPKYYGAFRGRASGNDQILLVDQPLLDGLSYIPSAMTIGIRLIDAPVHEVIPSLQNTTGSKANRMKLASTKKGIENFLTGSLLEIRPMSIAKLQGLQVT